jgi:hypothetical protein
LHINHDEFNKSNNDDVIVGLGLKKKDSIVDDGTTS